MCLFLSVSFSAPHSSELLQCESCYSCSGCLCCGKTAGTGFDHHSWLRSDCKGWVRFLFLLNVVCGCSRIWESGIRPNSPIPSISELAEVYCKHLLISCMLVRCFQLLLCKGLSTLAHFIYDIFYLPHWSMEHLRQVYRESSFVGKGSDTWLSQGCRNLCSRCIMNSLGLSADSSIQVCQLTTNKCL